MRAREDCEFVWLPEPEVDTQKQMTVVTGYVKVGMMTPDEGREHPLPLVGSSQVVGRSRPGAAVRLVEG